MVVWILTLLMYVSASPPGCRTGTVGGMMKMKHNGDVDNGQNPYSSADSSVSYLKRDSYMENGGQVVSKRDDVRRSKINLIISVGGIYGCYLLSGLLQEDIYVYRAENGGRFIYTFFLLWIQCIVNVCFSYVSSKIGEYVHVQQILQNHDSQPMISIEFWQFISALLHIYMSVLVCIRKYFHVPFLLFSHTAYVITLIPIV